MWSLTQTQPALSSRVARLPRYTSRVHAEAARPYGVSFARARPSSSVSKGSTTRTGPKISDWTISLSWAASVTKVGR
jgi:hypothetical protein